MTPTSFDTLTPAKQRVAHALQGVTTPAAQHVFTQLYADAALASAEQCDAAHEAGRELGRLHGVCITLKDNIDVAGETTMAGGVVCAGEAPALTMTKYFPSTHSLLVLNLWSSHKSLSNGFPIWLGLIHYHKTWHLQFQPLKNQTILQQLKPADQLLIQDLKPFMVKKITYPTSKITVLFIK